MAEIARNVETAEKLRSESDRIDFKLQLAGVRNVKAARALLADHGNDVDKLKEAEPWLFEGVGKHAKGGAAGSFGSTGLPNAGAATDEGKTLKHRLSLPHTLGSPQPLAPAASTSQPVEYIRPTSIHEPASAALSAADLVHDRSRRAA